MRRKLLLFFALIGLKGILIGQATDKMLASKNKIGKYHYILHHVNDIDSIKLYNTALSKLNLDEFRLIENRRIISFDSGVTLELLSGNELKNKYGKPISPFNKKNDSNIIFYIKSDVAEVIVKQKKN